MGQNNDNEDLRGRTIYKAGIGFLPAEFLDSPQQNTPAHAMPVVNLSNRKTHLVTGDKDSILILGKKYRMEIRYNDISNLSSGYEITRNRVILYMRSNAGGVVVQQMKEAIWAEALQQEIRRFIKASAVVLKHYPPIIKPITTGNKITTSNYTLNTLWINVQLAQFDPQVIEYYTDRELCNLVCQKSGVSPVKTQHTIERMMDVVLPKWRAIYSKFILPRDFESNM